MSFSRFFEFIGSVIQYVISILLLTISIVIVMFFTVGFNQPVTSTAKRETAPAVEVTTVREHIGGLDFRVDGEVIPFRRLTVVPEIQGRVVFKSDNCRSGRFVQKDEVLLQIDPTDFELEIQQLTEAVSQAETNIHENTIRRENTQRALDLASEQLKIRAADLARYESVTSAGAHSSTELDAVRLALLTCQNAVLLLENEMSLLAPQMEGLASALRRSQASLQLARLNLNRTKVTAPISGIITSDSVEVNSYLQKGSTVAEILDTSLLEIQCSLQMKQIKWIWLSGNTGNGGGTVDETVDTEQRSQGGYIFEPIPVTILYELDGDHSTWKGNLQTLSGGGVNSKTRMVPCRVVVENPHRGTAAMPSLLAGMYVSIIVHATPDVTLYKIPEKALHPGNRVWMVTPLPEENGQTRGLLRRLTLHIATTTAEGVLFYAEKDGPQPDDCIVVSPLAAPKEGDTVTILDF